MMTRGDRKVNKRPESINLFRPGISGSYPPSQSILSSLLPTKSRFDSQDWRNLTYQKGPYPGLPKKVLGMYILLADDTEDGYHTDNGDWEPLLHPYQQSGANVLFFTFINPATMEVPVSFKKLAATRGTNVEGAVPSDTLIIFAIGGYAYSINPNPWDWLTSKEKA